MNMIQLQPHTSTENVLVLWLERLTAKQVIWVPSLVKSLNFLEFFLLNSSHLDEDYQQTR